MHAFEIEIENSDHPYLVIADGVKEAVTKLEEQASALKGRPIGIKRIQKLSYTGDNIVV